MTAERRLYRKIYETLDRTSLWRVVEHYDIEVSDRRSYESLVTAVLRTGDRVKLDEVLSWLSRVELQTICSELGLEIGGREKEGYRTAILEYVRAKGANTDRQERDSSDSPASSRKRVKSQPSNRVFLVHGHDDAMRLEIRQFVEKLQLSPIVLQDEPNKGQTVMEKLERHRDESTYAVVLLSPDDLGYSKTAGPETAKPRARQNVILELGMMIGVLGRDHVSVLHRGNLELPSDIGGLVWIAYSPDHVDSAKFRLARELRSAGFDVDLNLIL